MRLSAWASSLAALATATPATVATDRFKLLPPVARVATVAVAKPKADYARESFTERVAIIEANGVPREWAEGHTALRMMSPPPDYSPHRWQQIVNDAGHFIDVWGKQTAAMGWNPVECFHPVHGLVTLIEGGEVRAITADTCSTERNTLRMKQSNLCRLVALAGETKPIWRIWSSLSDPKGTS